MAKVVVLGTGGTIATRVDAAGVGRAADSSAQLVAGVARDVGVELHARDVLVVNSFLLSPALMVDVARAVHGALGDPDVAGVVVTHGTDTLEETAYLLDLVHEDPRPVVLTGAQRSADSPDADGPRNLADAIRVAADPDARDLGVLVVFDARVYAARGTRKTHTLAPAAFSAPDTGPLGHLHDGRLALASRPVRTETVSLHTVEMGHVRVDVASFYPGADAVALRAFAVAGARGVVLQGSGAGNANPETCEAVAELTAAGVVVGLSSRVDVGPVALQYGGGGAVDAVAAGAVPLGSLKAPQARVLLAVLLASLRDAQRVRDALPRFVHH